MNKKLKHIGFLLMIVGTFFLSQSSWLAWAVDMDTEMITITFFAAVFLLTINKKPAYVLLPFLILGAKTLVELSSIFGFIDFIKTTNFAVNYSEIMWYIQTINGWGLYSTSYIAYRVLVLSCILFLIIDFPGLIGTYFLVRKQKKEKEAEEKMIEAKKQKNRQNPYEQGYIPNYNQEYDQKYNQEYNQELIENQSLLWFWWLWWLLKKLKEILLWKNLSSTSSNPNQLGPNQENCTCWEWGVINWDNVLEWENGLESVVSKEIMESQKLIKKIKEKKKLTWIIDITNNWKKDLNAAIGYFNTMWDRVFLQEIEQEETNEEQEVHYKLWQESSIKKAIIEASF